MTWLAQALVQLFGGTIAWLATTVAKRILIIAAVVAAVGALISFMLTRLWAAWMQAEFHSAPSMIRGGIAWLPSNVDDVFGLVLSVELAIWLYYLARRFLEYRLNV